jgi:hypothetical protein
LSLPGSGVEVSDTGMSRSDELGLRDAAYASTAIVATVPSGPRIELRIVQRNASELSRSISTSELSTARVPFAIPGVPLTLAVKPRSFPNSHAFFIVQSSDTWSRPLPKETRPPSTTTFRRLTGECRARTLLMNAARSPELMMLDNASLANFSSTIAWRLDPRRGRPTAVSPDGLTKWRFCTLIPTFAKSRPSTRTVTAPAWTIRRELFGYRFFWIGIAAGNLSVVAARAANTPRARGTTSPSSADLAASDRGVIVDAPSIVRLPVTPSIANSVNWTNSCLTSKSSGTSSPSTPDSAAASSPLTSTGSRNTTSTWTLVGRTPLADTAGGLGSCAAPTVPPAGTLPQFASSSSKRRNVTLSSCGIVSTRQSSLRT